MELTGQRVVVTGGAGFIGSHVVDKLVEIGSEVVVLDDLSVSTGENLATAEAAGATLVVGDVCDAETVAGVVADAVAVIHMACDNLRASLGAPMHTHNVNATGTLTMCLAAVEAGVRRFAYVSSSEAYGTATTIPMAEDHPLNPTTVYGASKAAGELYAHSCLRTYGLPSLVIRPFNSYGPRGHVTGTSAEVIPKFVKRIAAGERPVIFGDGSQTRDFTWVEETAAGIVAAAACDELVGGSINVAFGRGISIREVCDHLLEIFDARGLEPLVDERRPGDVDHHYADTTKAKSLIGFEATVPIREGLERYTAWMRDKGELDAGAPVAVHNW